MEKVKQYFTDMNKEKGLQIGTVVLAAVGIIGALVFFFTNCMNLTATKRYNAYFALIFIVMIALTVYLARILVLNKNWSYPRLFVILAIGQWLVEYQMIVPVNTMAYSAGAFAYNSDEAREESVNRMKQLGICTGDEIENLYNAFLKTIGDSMNYVDDIQNKTEYYQ